MQIILQPLQSLIVQLSRKLIKSLKPTHFSGYAVVQLKVRNFGIVGFFIKIPRRMKKCENVVTCPSFYSSNMLIKVLQSLKFSLYFIIFMK